MENIPHAQPSPRVVNGVLEWYQGDTFAFNIVMDDLADQDNVPVILGGTDKVNVTFRRTDETVVKDFAFPASGTQIQNNTVNVVFDTTVTALFSTGAYVYDVAIVHSDRVTLARRNKAVVK